MAALLVGMLPSPNRLVLAGVASSQARRTRGICHPYGVHLAVKESATSVEKPGMRLKGWLKTEPLVVPAQAASVSPDSVMLSQRTDAAVLDLVRSETLQMDQSLVAQIRERISAQNAAATHALT